MKKIMFNERFDLNRAVLQGEKTNTRRNGHPVEDSIIENYIGTVQMYEGKLVFHVFEIKEV